jgi:hypothetical protein
MDVMGLEKDAFVDGAVIFFEFAKDADVTLTF